MYPKRRAIKSFIAKLTIILLNQFPVAFQGFLFVRFSIELIHDLNADTVHSTAEMLDNMETVEYYLGIWK